MDALITFTILAATVFAVACICFSVILGTYKAFKRCWWLALILLIVLPIFLIGWAICEVLFDLGPEKTPEQ